MRRKVCSPKATHKKVRNWAIRENTIAVEKWVMKTYICWANEFYFAFSYHKLSETRAHAFFLKWLKKTLKKLNYQKWTSSKCLEVDKISFHAWNRQSSYLSTCHSTFSYHNEFITCKHHLAELLTVEKSYHVSDDHLLGRIKTNWFPSEFVSSSSSQNNHVVSSNQLMQLSTKKKFVLIRAHVTWHFSKTTNDDAVHSISFNVFISHAQFAHSKSTKKLISASLIVIFKKSGKFQQRQRHWISGTKINFQFDLWNFPCLQIIFFCFWWRIMSDRRFC